MRKTLLFLLVIWISALGWAQEPQLPSDFRQHTLTQFNASFLNATYAANWNRPNSLSVWMRWQWQTLDGDPTTTFLNYTHNINKVSTVAVGFLQHNTGTFLQTGGHFNYVHKFSVDEGVDVYAGTNVFASQRSLADDRVIPDSQMDTIQLETAEGFIVRFSPGIRLQANQFGLGLAFENAFGFGGGEGDFEETSNFKTITGSINYDVPVSIFSNWGHSFVRPMLYVKSVPNGDTQIGVNGLLSTPKVWLQGGYNSFYGASAGLGVTLGGVFSIGGLMEFGADTSLTDEDSTLEILLSYKFDKKPIEEEEPIPDMESEEEIAVAKRKEEELQKKKEALEEQQRLEQEQKQRTEQRLEQERKQKEQKLVEQQLLEKQKEELAQKRLQEEQRRKDSIQAVQLAELQQKREQRKQDSLVRVQAQKVEVEPNEKYEEVSHADGLEPGFYLIANVFGTKKYFENFMKTLQQKGLEPKSFFRSVNQFNYVYLERYNTMQEARKARDSKFSGKYPDKTWIFRVRGN